MQTKYVVLRTGGDEQASTRGFDQMLPSGSLSMSAELLDDKQVQQLRNEHGVAGVAPSMPMTHLVPRNRPLDVGVGHEDWPFDATGTEGDGWTGRGVTVALLDSGIDRTNRAFSGIELETHNFSEEHDGADRNGHGTHCAGIVFGRDVDGYRIGVARGVERALVGKVIGQNGASSAALIEGILWAVEKGADIISMSLGLDFTRYARDLRETGYEEAAATSAALDAYTSNVELFQALVAFVSASERGRGGVVFCAASGNRSERPLGPTAVVRCGTPASADNIISVGALQRSPSGLELAPFSNSNVDFVAPGVDILSAWPNDDLKLLSGTSMATPHVAGLAALWLEQLRARTGYDDVTAGHVRACLTASATQSRIAGSFDRGDVGFGIPQAPPFLEGW